MSADWEALHRRLWREVLSMEHAAEALGYVARCREYYEALRV